MRLELEMPGDLSSRIVAAALAQGLTVNEFVVLAAAEKLARIEHERWLSERYSQTNRKVEDGEKSSDVSDEGAQKQGKQK